MSVRDDVHRLVDELDEGSLPDAEERLRQLVQRDRESESAGETADAVAALRRRWPWIGSLRSGPEDLAERSSETLRRELGARSE